MRRGGRAPARRGFRAVRLGHPVQRAAHAARTAVEDVGVDHRGGHVLVVQLLLHRPDAIAGLDEVRGKRMSQRVAGRGLAVAAAPHRALHRTLQHGFIQVMPELLAAARIDAARAGRERLLPHSLRARRPGICAPAHPADAWPK